MTLTTLERSPSAWQPGSPLYPSPAFIDRADSQVVRPLFEVLADTHSTTLSFPFPVSRQVRFCRPCEVLWADDSTHCWFCDKYARPPYSKRGRSYAVFTFITNVLTR